MRGGAPRWHWAVGACSALLATIAVLIALYWQQIFDYMLAWQLTLTPTSRSYKEWVAPTVPIFFEVFLFNWTNADRFPGEKPNLEQLGPYRFREERRHVNVTWHPHNDSVAYRTFRSWHYDAETSNGTLEDQITTLNILAASAAYKSRFKGFMNQQFISYWLRWFGHQMSISKLVGELLFDGYEDGLLDMAKFAPISWTDGAPMLDRFGLFYGRNNTIDTDGYMEVTTGAAAGSLPGQILRWNYEDHLPYYSGKCSKLEGSAGEFMGRNLSQAPLGMFVPDLCRSLKLEYLRAGTLGGLPIHTYAVTDRSFDNSTTSPSNTCFCNGECLWGGVMNVSACRFGSPSFISLPHFLHADQALRDLVDGMEPDPEKHSFYFSVEPKLGVPLDVAARFQYNVYIDAYSYMELYYEVPRMLFPIFWVQQKVVVEDKVISELLVARTAMEYGGIISAGVALVFMAILTAIVSSCFTNKPKYTRPIYIQPQVPKDEAEMKLNPK